MTVRELIDRLNELSPDLLVMVYAEDHGTYDLTKVEIFNWPDRSERVELS